MDQWKDLHKLSKSIDPSLFQVTAGEDYNEVSARVVFAVPHESWKTANRVDRDVRQLWNDMVDRVWSAELDTEFAWDEPADSIWILSLVLWSGPAKALKEPLLYIKDSVRQTRLEEFLVSPNS